MHLYHSRFYKKCSDFGEITCTVALRPICLRRKEDAESWRRRILDSGSGRWATGYQTLIDEVLRQHVEGKAPKFEETLRRIVREEVRAAG
jgi:hypothetical protein